MELYAAFFILGFLAALGLLLYKFYNCMKLGVLYEFPGIVLTFLGYFLAWVVCFVVWMQEPQELLYANLMYLLNWLILVNLLLSVVEGLIQVKVNTVDNRIMPFKSGEDRRTAYTPTK